MEVLDMRMLLCEFESYHTARVLFISMTNREMLAIRHTMLEGYSGTAG